MAISLDKVFGIHERALMVRAKRAEILASNLANADTPNYKSRDIDFQATLAQAERQQTSRVSTTHTHHISVTEEPIRAELLYRIPEQASLDGNTVDSRIEQTDFAENAIQYQVSLALLNKRIQGLRGAIRGE
jgi:flagellar basal-body rod protein FlgB